MSKKKGDGPIPGIETSKVKGVVEDINIDNVKKWLKDDITRALNVLTAIKEDERIQTLVAEHFYSKWYNSKHAEFNRAEADISNPS